MRILIGLPLFFLAACQVSKDEQNDTISATYNSDVAENVVADVGNVAEDVAEDVKNLDVDVEVRTDGNAADANAN